MVGEVSWEPKKRRPAWVFNFSMAASIRELHLCLLSLAVNSITDEIILAIIRYILSGVLLAAEPGDGYRGGGWAGHRCSGSRGQEQ